MGCFPEGAFASIPKCGLAGKRTLRLLFRLTGLLVALALNPIAAPVHAAGPTDPVVSPPPPTFPGQGLALENPGRGERSLISLDPVAARVVAGTWTMPAKDEMVTFRNAQGRRWQAVQATPEGTFDLAGRGSYLAVEIGSEDERILILEASGHAPGLSQRRAARRRSLFPWICPAAVPASQRVQHVLVSGRSRPSGHRPAARAAASAVLNPGDVTAPDLIVDEPVNAEASIVVINASQLWTDGLTIVSQLPGGEPVRTSIPALSPLSVRKVGFRLTGPATREFRDLAVKLTLQGHASTPAESLDTTILTLRVRKPEQARKRTFRSTIDGSVQYYGLVPARPERGNAGDEGKAPGRPGLVLTLHGASVEAIGQAEAYAGKPGLHIVAPTNRRPYGFDWEDWGRLDALEVLERAQEELQTDPRRTYLTGHSMGGHGAWHLGVTFPDRFAVVAPSAGWISMWSYAGAKRVEKPSPLEQLVAPRGQSQRYARPGAEPWPTWGVRLARRRRRQRPGQSGAADARGPGDLSSRLRLS